MIGGQRMFVLKKSNIFLGSRDVVIVKTIPLMYQLQTDTRFWNPHMETCRHTKNFNSKLKVRSCC